MKPSIGRIVHYVDAAKQHLAAVITRVWSDTCVNLVVLEPYEGVTSVVMTSRMRDDGGERWTWHWPEKVE